MSGDAAGPDDPDPVRIDLHLHSTASDGTLSPSALVWAARAGGLHLVALTDHDTTDGLHEAMTAARHGIRVVPGIEISTTHEGADLHFLGYFIDPGNAALRTHSATALERRRERMAGMIRLLREQGIAIDMEDVVAAAGSTAVAMGRPHLARALLERGHVQTVAEAFDRFLAAGAPAYIPTALVSPRMAIDLVHEAGGLAVWAHPPMDHFDSELRRFADWGLDGVECFRPRTPGPDVHRLVAAAEALGLLVSGGSDWHGAWHGALGEFFVTWQEVGRLLEAGGLGA